MKNENIIISFALGEGELLGILGRDVPPSSQNPDPISGQNMRHFLHLFSDLDSKIPLFRPVL